MTDVAIDMVNHFMDGTASDYWNATLINKMEEHSSTEKYITDITNIINSYIGENDGDILGLHYDTDDRDNLPLIKQMRTNDVYEPVYSDKFSGLGICVDGLYGNEIEISSYKFDGTNYEYTLKFTMYDIYGLDSANIEENKYVDNVSGFGILAGFRSWYILQHCNLYGGDYQPFITCASFKKQLKEILNEKKNNHRYDNSLNYCINHNWNAAL